MSRRVRHIDPSIGWTASSARAKVEAGAEGGQRRSVEKPGHDKRQHWSSSHDQSNENIDIEETRGNSQLDIERSRLVVDTDSPFSTTTLGLDISSFKHR